ncbi:hypothetical protein ACFSJ3_16595 [Corallincola platygyrae]|uniref:Uncharacterized protein n=1 Tax=Corallincola platygyrae TaxID=1193278 RepID=A0ABW4XPY5_9GAMM
MKYTCTITLTLLAIAGCATTYIPPTGKSLVSLRVEAPQFVTSTGARVVYYPGADCSNPEILGYVSSIKTIESDPQVEAIPDTALNSSSYFEKRIPAGESFQTSFKGYVGNRECLVSTSFIPRKKASYVMMFSHDNEQCYLRIREFDTGSNDATGVTVSYSEPEKTCQSGFAGPV